MYLIVKKNNSIYFVTFSHMTVSTVKFYQSVMCEVLSVNQALNDVKFYQSVMCDVLSL